MYMYNLYNNTYHTYTYDKILRGECHYAAPKYTPTN